MVRAPEFAGHGESAADSLSLTYSEVEWIDVKHGLRDCLLLSVAFLTISLLAAESQIQTQHASSGPHANSTSGSLSITLCKGKGCNGVELYIFNTVWASGGLATNIGDCLTPFNTSLTTVAYGFDKGGVFSWFVTPSFSHSLSFYPATGCTNLANSGPVDTGKIYDSNGAPGVDAAWSATIGVQDIFGFSYTGTAQYLMNVYSDANVYAEVEWDGHAAIDFQQLISTLFGQFIGIYS